MRRLVPAVLIACLSLAPAMAQQPVAGKTGPAAASTAASQRDAIEQQNQRMEAAARQVAALVDTQRSGEVWDGASAVTRKLVTRAQFIQGISQDRQRLGALVSRGQASVSRVQYREGAAVPAGIYLNVSFATRFASSAQPVRELVSFRLDEDKVWRVSGYSLRAPGQ